MSLISDLQDSIGIKPRKAFDDNCYLDIGSIKPTDEEFSRLETIIKKVAKKHRYDIQCQLHQQPGIGCEIYTIFCLFSRP